MKFRFVGTNHYDPNGPSRLAAKLREVRAAESSNPAFIAVEGNRRNLEATRQQRGKLKELCRTVFEIEDESMLDKLASTIQYEADAPDAVYQNVRTFGLDDNDDRYERLKDYMAVLRLQVYLCKCLDGTYTPSERNKSNLLRKLSFDAWSPRVSPPPDLQVRDRDQELFQTIQLELQSIQADSQDPAAWALVIVGESHCDAADPKSLNSLLRNEGHSCQADSLRPTVMGPS
jgi:hypothetical protein